MTMLAMLSQYGYKGSDAGTLLRNTMIRIIAPTATANKQLELLGFTQEDVNDAFGENAEAVMSSMDALKEYGFSAYDTKGNLKSFQQIFIEMGSAMQKMSEADRNGVLKTLFGTRAITGAMSLMDAVNNGWNGVYEAVMQSGGAAQAMSDVMMDTQKADLAILNSHFETLKVLVGQEQTGQIRSFADSIGGFITGLNNLPEEQFSAIVAGFESFAAIGTGLAVAAGAIKVLSALGVAGGIGLTAAALVSIASAMNDLRESEYANMFGDMQLDEESVSAYINAISGDFDKAFTNVNKFNT